MYPCSISSVDNVNDYQPTLLKGKDRERVINRLLEYSTKLKYGITKDDVIFAEEMTDMDKAEDSTGR